MITTMPDHGLVQWLRNSEENPRLSKAELKTMYDYFKVQDVDVSSGSNDNDETKDKDKDKSDDASSPSDPEDDAVALFELIQADDQKYCFLTFRKNKEGDSTALLFHHMVRYPSRLGDDSPFSGRWFITGGEPVGGVHIIYDVPPTCSM